jgi:hypothetical protein
MAKSKRQSALVAPEQSGTAAPELVSELSAHTFRSPSWRKHVLPRIDDPLFLESTRLAVPDPTFTFEENLALCKEIDREATQGLPMIYRILSWGYTLGRASINVSPAKHKKRDSEVLHYILTESKVRWKGMTLQQFFVAYLVCFYMRHQSKAVRDESNKAEDNVEDQLLSGYYRLKSLSRVRAEVAISCSKLRRLFSASSELDPPPTTPELERLSHHIDLNPDGDSDIIPEVRSQPTGPTTSTTIEAVVEGPRAKDNKFKVKNLNSRKYCYKTKTEILSTEEGRGAWATFNTVTAPSAAVVAPVVQADPALYHQVISTAFSAPVDDPADPLTDYPVIRAVLWMLNRFVQLHSQDPHKVVFLPSYAAMQAGTAGDDNHPDETRALLPIDDCDTLVAPLFVGANHWVLLALRRTTKMDTIYCIDSLPGGKVNRESVERLARVGKAREGWKLRPLGVTKQKRQRLLRHVLAALRHLHRRHTGLVQNHQQASL